jgi:hypothetical protein
MRLLQIHDEQYASMNNMPGMMNNMPGMMGGQNNQSR